MEIPKSPETDSWSEIFLDATTLKELLAAGDKCLLHLYELKEYSIFYANI